MKESSALFAGDNETISCTVVDAGRRSAGENVANPHSSSVYGEHQDVVDTADLHRVLPEQYYWARKRWAEERSVISSRGRYAC